MVALNPRISMPPTWAAELLGGLSIGAAAPAPASGAPAGAAASGVAAVQLGGTDRPPRDVRTFLTCIKKWSLRHASLSTVFGDAVIEKKDPFLLLL